MTPEQIRWANTLLEKLDKLKELRKAMCLQSIYEINAYLDDVDESRVHFDNGDSYGPSLVDAMVWWIDRNIDTIKAELVNTGITFEEGYFDNE